MASHLIITYEINYKLFKFICERNIKKKLKFYKYSWNHGSIKENWQLFNYNLLQKFFYYESKGPCVFRWISKKFLKIWWHNLSMILTLRNFKFSNFKLRIF